MADPNTDHWLVHMLARELAQQQHMATVAQLSVPQRLIHFVLRLADTCSPCQGTDGSVRLDIALRKTELAEIVWASRETISRATKVLSRHGLIRFSSSMIEVPAGSRLLDQPAFAVTLRSNDHDLQL